METFTHDNRHGDEQTRQASGKYALSTMLDLNASFSFDLLVLGVLGLLKFEALIRGALC